MRKIKYVFNESLAKRLCNIGYPIIYIRKDHKNKDKDVYLFEDTARLRKDFEMIASRK
jgi:hypothetical protein